MDVTTAPIENTSGRGDEAVLPPELRGLNWGAFLLSWVWGIGNSVWISLLFFVPFFGLAMPFVLLFKGNEWAWKKRYWQSAAHFKSTQRSWARWALVVYVVMALLGTVPFYFFMAEIRSSQYFKMALDEIRSDPTVVAALGEPIEAGWLVVGSIKYRGSSGSAEISFPVKGSRSSGTAYLHAEKTLGEWTIVVLNVELRDTGELITLVPRKSASQQGQASETSQALHQVSKLRIRD